MEDKTTNLILIYHKPNQIKVIDFLTIFIFDMVLKQFLCHEAVIHRLNIYSVLIQF